MNKTINLTKQEAIKFYNSSNDEGFKNLLETNFGKDFYKQDITDIVYDLESLKQYWNDNKQSYFKLPYDRCTNDKLEKTLNAVYILAKVAEVYNEGAVLSWKNTNEYKYLPYKYFSGVSCGVLSADVWNSCLSAAGCLYYKNKDISIKSHDNFKCFWEDYWDN